MMPARLILIVIPFVLAACGGSKTLKCDEGPYQMAVRAPKVQAPEGLDNLDPLNEIPLPAASPREPSPADGPCLESPPQIIGVR
jgi:uncharacterized lipoprotein